MTAIVGILNKRAVAIAADSAVTVTSGGSRKIYNTSQKIFKLSDKNPVAVMTYENVDFMETPLDVIIEMYRSERGHKTFKTMEDCSEDFLKYLYKADGFLSESMQRNYCLREMLLFYDKVTVSARARADKEIESERIADEKKKDDCYRKHLLDVFKVLTERCKEEGKAINFKNYSIRKYKKYSAPYWEVFEKELLEEPFPEGMKEEFQRSFYEYITSECFYYGSGLVFIGYGSKDLYPSYHSIYVSGIFDGRLRYFVDDHDGISNETRAIIQPFAQDDVMMTMMKGIAPEFLSAVREYHQSSLDKLKSMIVDEIKKADVSPEILEKVANISTEDLQKEHGEKLSSFIDDNYVDGIVDAVESFNIEDMSNMAENLISITNLQRHFSSSEETVGGPVEVAVITRSGGFKWIKHRQW